MPASHCLRSQAARDDLRQREGTPPRSANPRLVIEVLSPSTERRDRGWKFRNYQLIPSFEEYLLVSQDEPRVERFLRQDSGWLMTAASGLDCTLRLESVDCELPLAENYEDVVFGPVAEE